jgi:AcrR family transcriptional regulator
VAGEPKRRTRSRSRHTEILDEAARQFNRRGVSLNAFKDIADALGVSRRALYHYVADREDLVFQCYRRTCATLEGLLVAADEGRGALATIDRFYDLIFAPGQSELCAITEPGLLRPEQAAEIAERHQRVVARLAEILAAGQARGELRAFDTAVIAECIIGVPIWLPVSNLWSTGQTAAPIDETLAFTKSFIREGWAADRSRRPDYPRLDVSTFAVPVVEAFDREGLSEAKREKILATASWLFNRKGIDSTSLEEIAGELGATPRAVYHHVGDKAQLVSECYLRTLRLVVAVQTETKLRGLPHLQANVAFQHAWCLAIMRPDVAPLMPLAGFEALSDKAKAAFREQVESVTSIAVNALDAGMAEGSLRRFDRRATRLNTGTFGWLTRGTITDPAAQEAAAGEIAALHALGIAALRA